MKRLSTIPRLRHKEQTHSIHSLAAAFRGAGVATISAPAHPFQAETKTGILWEPDRLAVWQHGECLDSAELASDSPQACWSKALFVEAFPQVSHWWFGSLWTQRVRATAMIPQEAGITRVWLQAVQEDADELVWTVPSLGMPFGALPEYAGGTLNKPLYLRLGNLARLVASQAFPLNEWVVVSSLVTGAELRALLANGVIDSTELCSTIG
jgi:hypothetical protein